MIRPNARLSAVLAGAALLAAPALAVAKHGADDGATSVEIEDLAFHPATKRIARGATVVWRWRDGAVPHNVTFSRFHSATKTSGTYRHTFTRRGTFTYRCTIHPGMTGKVIVR